MIAELGQAVRVGGTAVFTGVVLGVALYVASLVGSIGAGRDD